MALGREEHLNQGGRPMSRVKDRELRTGIAARENEAREDGNSSDNLLHGAECIMPPPTNPGSPKAS